MSAAEFDVNRPHFGQVYMWSLVTAGAAITLVSIYYLPFGKLDAKFVFLCLMVIASSMIAIRIPRVSGRITVADTFVFLGMLMYGGAAAILLSALEGVAVTVIISKKPRVFLFNSAILATSTFFTSTVLNLVFGPPATLISKEFSREFFIAMLIEIHGFYAVVATVPIILIICFTYQTYLKNIAASLEQTEAARLHVEELSKYVSELQRSEEA